MKKSKLSRLENFQGYMFVLPWIIGFLVFTLGPLIFSLITSFTDYSVGNEMQSVGFANYERLMNDDLYKTAFQNTIYYVIVSVPISIIASISLALLLNSNIPGIKIFRTIYYLPAVVSGVGVTILWMQLLNPNSGLINTLLGYVGIKGPAWLQDPNWTKPALILMGVWSVGGNMLIYLSSLKSIPDQLYESAKIDGANWFQRLYKITLPMITPVIFFNLITSIIGAFQIFQSAYIMTNSGTGGPMNSLLFYNVYLWNKAFGSFEMGYAAAMAWILFIIVMILTVINFTLSRFWVHYEGGERVD